MASENRSDWRQRVGEVARLFTKLGFIGFGGPAAHVALMHEEVVRRRGWIDDAEFLDLVGATNLIPGPNSTELALHLGHRRAGWRGLLTAGIGFIGPAVVIVGFLAWLYQRYGTTPAVVDLRYGILPVIIAIIAHALHGLGRTALNSRVNIVVALAALGAYLAGVHELFILIVAGTVTVAWSQRSRLAAGRMSLVIFPMLAEPTQRATVSLWRLFAVFLEIGSVLYGSGYVLLAFLRSNLVDDLGWLTDRQLLDAITVGQITPGPVFTTATFVGWQISGVAGAAVATVGIFGPSFVFVALLGRIVPWMRARPAAKAFLTGLTTASLGLMAGVFIELSRSAISDVLTAVIAVSALVVLLRTKLNSAWLIGAGLAIGILHTLAT